MGLKMMPFFCFACCVLTAFWTCSVADAREAFTGDSDQDRQVPQCTICTSEDCGIGTCSIDFNMNNLIALQVNVSCQNGTGSGTVIAPQRNDTVSLEESRETCRGYSVVHTFGCLTSPPVNLYLFPSTKELNLAGNRLTAFPNLTCLTELVTLNLRWNSITSVPRDAFVGLTKLRDILLEYNNIASIDPFAFSTPLPNLNNVMLQNNKLETAEMWFLNFKHKFCKFNLKGNLISRFTNQQDVNVKKLRHKIGPGFVDFSYNRLRRSPTAQLAQYGVHSVRDLANFLDWGFDFRNNPVSCDCELYDLMNTGSELLRVIWRNYFKVVCDSPPELRGKEVVDVPLDKLVCNITEGCPHNCTCQDQPSKGYVHVDCEGAGLVSLPVAMPTDKPLKLDLRNNSIEVLESRDYLKRVLFLDLGRNNLKHISPETPNLLRKVQRINLRGNSITYLPDTLQILSSFTVALDPYTLSCHCEMTWFNSWKLPSNRNEETGNGGRAKGRTGAGVLSDGSNDVIFCRLQDGSYLPMNEATKERLSCLREVTPFPLIVTVAVVAGVVVCVVTLTAIFRFEILVLFHTLLILASQEDAQCIVVGNEEKGDVLGNEELGQKQRAPHGYVYDLFISASDSETDLDWVMHRLLPELDHRGIKSYLLPRDSPVGVVAVDEAVKRIQESHVVLVVLTGDYAANATCLFQFGQAYNFTLGRSACESVKNTRRKLVVLRVDRPAKYGDVGEPRLKAMLRMKMTYWAENQKDMDRVYRTIKHA